LLTIDTETGQAGAAGPLRSRAVGHAELHAGDADTAFGCPRNFLDNKYIYLVFSPRARGLTVGVNLSPDHTCNFDCVYCEVDHTRKSEERLPDLEVVARELESVLTAVHEGRIWTQPPFDQLDRSLRKLKHVTISGDGEPTLCPLFRESVETITHIRVRGVVPFFRMVLLTNTTGLDQPDVQAGLKLFVPTDEIWAKLDVGTQAGMDLINRGDIPLKKVLENILLLARVRPVVIQSLFTAIDDKRLPPSEIAEYAHRLKELKEQGAQIPLVQVYSANRPSSNERCRHLDLRELSAIAQKVRSVAGLHAEVF
jgi:wyosine [tRNA(Phe)-imidazoG37] synthetase (radical SAM superfamily)